MLVWTLAVFLPMAVLGEGEHGGSMECCPTKMLGQQQFDHEGMQNDTSAGTYGCKDFCVYILSGTQDRYCFAHGDGDVHCVTDNKLPPQCRDYNVLDESDRSSSSGRQDYCDQTSTPANAEPSPAFVGAGWYRMLAPAGQVIPQSPPDINHCGTAAPGWMQSTHPTQIGVTKDVLFCFSWDGNDCWESTSGQVTLCDTFYVYYLPETITCHTRYCAADQF